MIVRTLVSALLAGVLVAQPLLAAEPKTAPPPPPPPSTAGYQPQDKLERGLWYQMAEYERELKTSKFLVTDPALNNYVRGVLCRQVGQERCQRCASTSCGRRSSTRAWRPTV